MRLTSFYSYARSEILNSVLKSTSIMYLSLMAKFSSFKLRCRALFKLWIIATYLPFSVGSGSGGIDCDYSSNPSYSISSALTSLLVLNSSLTPDLDFCSFFAAKVFYLF